MSNKIIEYKILNAHAEEVNKLLHLQQLANEKIAEGWQPLSDLIVDSNGALYQTIVKYEQ
jgi:hypothetical protein